MERINDKELVKYYKREFNVDFCDVDRAEEALHYQAENPADFARQLIENFGTKEIFDLLEKKGLGDRYFNESQLGDYFGQDYVIVKTRKYGHLYFWAYSEGNVPRRFVKDILRRANKEKKDINFKFRDQAYPFNGRYDYYIDREKDPSEVYKELKESMNHKDFYSFELV